MWASTGTASRGYTVTVIYVIVANLNYNHLNPTECISFITFPLTAKPASLEALNCEDFKKGPILFTRSCFGGGEW